MCGNQIGGRGRGVESWFSSVPQAWSLGTGPAQNQQCELSISVGNKHHSGMTALCTDNK